MEGFPTLLIEQAQQTIKDTINAVIHENNPLPTGRGFFWGVEHFQRMKILLQPENMMFQNRDNIRGWLALAMPQMISGPADFQAALLLQKLISLL
jgi:hypothetical protein